MYLMGIDLGTTGCKSMVFDDNGQILSQSYIEYEIINVDTSCIEQDPRLWWDMVQKSISQSVKASNVSADKIKALSVSSQGISFVPIDKEGNTLYNAISWLDSRPVEQTDTIKDLFDDKEIFDRTGKRISPCYTLPKLMWIKQNLPQVYDATYKFLMGLDYITYKLTRQTVTDYSMASGTMAFNISTQKWDKEIISSCGLDIEKLPEVRCTTDVVGKIHPDVAKATGLHEDTLVVVGAQDQKCAAIGSGIREGIATVSLGTASAVSSISSKPVFDEQRRVPCFALDKDSWVLESVISTCGISLKWLKNTFYEDMDYAELTQLAEASTAGANGVYFYPHLEGATTPYWRDDIKGFIYGFSLGTAKEDIVRSLLEGIAFQIRINIELHQAINKNNIHEIRVFGGGSKSELWCRLIADITGKMVSVMYTSETANLGAAVIAGLGIGVYKDLDDILTNIKLVKKQFKPDKKTHLKYDEIFKDYIKTQEKILS